MQISMSDPSGVRLIAFLLCINDELDYFNEDIPRRTRARVLLVGSLAHDERKRKDNFSESNEVLASRIDNASS